MSELTETEIVSNLQDGLKFSKRTGYPVVLLPLYTLKGAGAAIAHCDKDLEEFLPRGLELSPVTEVWLNAKPEQPQYILS